MTEPRIVPLWTKAQVDAWLAERSALGYCFTPLVVLTPELLAAMRAIVHGFTSYLNPEEYEAELEVVRNITKEADDA